MMRRLILAALAATALAFGCPLGETPARAQNVTCSTVTPATTSNNQCADTAFVQGAISANTTHFAAGGTSTGSANAQVLATTSPPGFSLTGNPTVTFTAGFSNGNGGTTLNVVGTGVINILKKTPAGLVALVTGDIIAGQQYLATYDGTEYELQTPTLPVLAAIAVSGSAADLIAGIVPPARLPLPTTSTLGGVESVTCGAGQFVSAIPTTAVQPTCGVPGTGSPVRIATTNDTVLTSDCGKIIQLGTGSTGNISETLPASPATNGFTAPCTVKIVNGDNTTLRAKTLIGMPSDLVVGGGFCGATNVCLMPAQLVEVSLTNSGTTWATTISPGRWRPNNNPIFQVNHTSGTDNSDCMGTGAQACATLAHAIFMCQIYVDGVGLWQCQIQNAAETFLEQDIIVRGGLVGSRVADDSQDILIQGSPATPANTVWQVNGGHNCLLTTTRGSVKIDGFKVVSTGAGSNCFFAEKGSFIHFFDIEFGAFASGNHLVVAECGHIYFDGGTYKISGNMASHVAIGVCGEFLVQPVAISIPSALTFTTYLTLSGSSVAQFNSVSCTGTGCGAGSAGKQYAISGNAGIIYLQGTTLPGATAGTITTGQVF